MHAERIESRKSEKPKRLNEMWRVTNILPSARNEYTYVLRRPKMTVQKNAIKREVSWERSLQQRPANLSWVKNVTLSSSFPAQSIADSEFFHLFRSFWLWLSWTGRLAAVRVLPSRSTRKHSNTERFYCKAVHYSAFLSKKSFNKHAIPKPKISVSWSTIWLPRSSNTCWTHLTSSQSLVFYTVSS